MGLYLIKRVLQAIVTLLIVSVIIFGLARLTGNPLHILLPMEATQADFDRMSAELGFDKPIITQYGIFLLNAVQGDLGESVRFRRPVTDIIQERLPATLELGVISFLVILALALPIGVYAATHRGSMLDYIARGFAVIGQSVPPFWTGIILVLIFAVWLGWVPASGKSGPLSYILPVVTISYFLTAGIMRLVRSSMLEVLDSEYIKLARAKGLPERLVIWKHAFKNAALPVLTFSTVIFVRLLIGSIVTETVFAWPGIGRLVIESVKYRDYPLIQAIVLIMSAMYITGNLIADILYAYINPRIRYQK